MITSTSNPTIKQIRKLRDRKERQQTGLSYIEGLKIVGLAVQLGAKFESLVVAPELLTSSFGHQLIDQIKTREVPVLEVSRQVFENISLKEGPQGIAALIHQNWLRVEEFKPAGVDLWVALDSVQDPGNLGTIMRTLDSVGGKGIILLDQSTDPYDPTAVRASMGALFTLKLFRTSFDEFSRWKKEHRMWVVGTSGSARVNYTMQAYPSGLVLLMGSERMGLLEHHYQICDQVVSIPMVGFSDSLNLAVATAVVLYEIYNQHHGRQPFEQTEPEQASGRG